MKNRILCAALAIVLSLLPVMQVNATTISDAKKQKQEAENKLNSVNEDIENIESGKEEIEGEIEEIDGRLVDLLLTVDILSSDINDKDGQIREAQTQYDDAKAKEEVQHTAMKKRIKFMYEKGDRTYLELFLQSQSISDLVNKVDYVEKLYEYDRKLLLDYQQTKEEVLELKTNLENEKAEMEEMQADYISQSDSLQTMIDEKQNSIENFDTQLAAAKKQASTYQTEIKAQAAAIKQLEAEEAARKKAEEEAKKKAEAEAAAKKKAEQEASAKSSEPSSSGSSGGSSGGSSSGGSATGRDIASYASQFVGNPYLAGGTSLTGGADCSGFTWAVYQHFGINLPRSSYAQACVGTEVSYADAQPGDIIYYGGHVGIYIGNGMIVHASTAATGIKYSSALYRTIITVRRFV